MPTEWKHVPMELRDMVIGHVQTRREELLLARKRCDARNDSQMSGRYADMIDAYDSALKELET